LGPADDHRTATDVTIPTRNGRRRPGITVHRCRIDPHDRAAVHGIPVTSIPRTLLDLAEVLAPTQLQRAYERAERLRVLDVVAVRELLARSNGRRGVAAVRALLDYDPAPAAEAVSELELRFLDLMRDFGPPRPHVNVLVEGYLVDAYWPAARLVVELQGYAYHSDRLAFERDHARLARLKLAGYEVLALTWHQVTKEPAWVRSALASLLAGRDRDVPLGSQPAPDAGPVLTRPLSRAR
jgi:very-short-patch-repair endonuclease